MNTADERLLSEGRIRLAIQRAAWKYPFHAAVLERFVLAVNPQVQTMGVSVFGERVHLWHRPAFVLALPIDQLVGVLIHEVNHVVFGHLQLDLKDFPDQWALLIATEVTVNEFVNEPLPPGCILLEQFPDLPRSESTVQRYHRLAGSTKRIKVMPLADFLAGGGRLDQPARGKDGEELVLVLDDHGAWQRDTDLQSSKEVLGELLADAAINVGPARVPEYLRGAMADLGIGTDPGSDADAPGQRTGQLHWRQLLRRYVGQSAAVRSDLRHPARRFPGLVGIVPGRRQLGGHPHILAVIDTSASMTVDLLEQVSGELARLASDYQITVVECDTMIQKTYRYRPLKVVFGRGGTDLRPPLERVFLRKHRADLVVYFTDGIGPAPDKKPAVPLIWCLTPGGETPAPWGRTIRMEHTVDG